MSVEDLRHLVSQKCQKCGEPVYADQGYYSITGEHWECHEPANALEKRSGAWNSKAPVEPSAFRRRRCREGQGRVARRVIKLAVAAIEQATGGQLHAVRIWNQQGAYRGMRWDLDAWGIDFRIVLDGHDFGGCASSLGTMTSCVRDVAQGGKMYAVSEGPLYFALFTRHGVQAQA